MKRIYACILIVAALLAVSLYSSGRVQGFAQDISADLDCALEAVRQKDFSTARQALAEGAELCDTMRETMSICCARPTTRSWKLHCGRQTDTLSSKPQRMRWASCAAHRWRWSGWNGLPGGWCKRHKLYFTLVASCRP